MDHLSFNDFKLKGFNDALSNKNFMPINFKTFKEYTDGYYYGLQKYFKYFYKSDYLNYFSDKSNFNNEDAINFLNTYYLYEYIKNNKNVYFIDYILNCKIQELLNNKIHEILIIN
jgi:hypothetical protein